MWFNNKEDINDFVRKEELDDVKSMFYKLEKQMAEITAGLGFAKWLLAASIGIVPVMTTILEEFKDEVQSDPPVSIPTLNRFIELPNGKIYDTFLKKYVE